MQPGFGLQHKEGADVMKETIEDPATLLRKYASRFNKVSLQARSWDPTANSNYCYLDIIREKEVILIDHQRPHIDIRRIPLDFGKSRQVGDSTVEFLRRQVYDAVSDFLKPYQFTLTLVDATPTVRFTLALSMGVKPEALFIPQYFEGSWKAFLPPGSREEAVYLQSVRSQQKLKRSASNAEPVHEALSQ